MYEGQMITSGLNNSGDVILAPEKKSHKKWIIIGVIALVVVVVLVVMFLIPRGGANLKGNGKEAFNRYANYLLYGNDSTAAISGEYDEGFRSKLNKVLDDEVNSSSTFAKNIETLWGDFMGKSNNFTVSDDLTRDSYNERVGFIATYLENYSNMDGEKLMQLVQNGSEKKVEQSINDYFSLFNNYNFDEANTYKEEGRSLYNRIVEWARSLKEAGCNTDEAMDGEECNSIYDSGENDVLNSLSITEGAVNSVADYLVKNVWAISGQVNGGNK